MWISDAGCNALGRAGGRHVLDEVPDVAGRRGVAVARSPTRPQLYQLGTQTLVDDEVDRGLDDAVVGRRQAAVEATDAVLSVDAAYTLQRRQRPVSSARANGNDETRKS